MGDDGGKSPQEGTGDVVQALQKSFPQLMTAIQSQYGGAAEAENRVTEKYTPKAAQIQADVLASQGKQLAKTGREISADEIRGAADTEAEVAEGPGQRTAAATLRAAKMLDPEYYESRPVISGSINKLLDYDPNQLNKGEAEGLARGLGRTGTFVPSASETAKNAVVFGKAGQERRQQYGNAISQAAGATAALRGPVNAAETTSRRQVLPNVGTMNYTGLQTPGVSSVNNLASGLQGTATTAMGINMGKELSDWDKYLKSQEAISKTASNVGTIAGMIAGACWVARAVYGVDDSRWLQFRGWLFEKAPRWFTRLYLRHGAWFATVVPFVPGLRRVLRYFMDKAIRSYTTTSH